MMKKERLRRELDDLKVEMVRVALDKDNLLDKEVQRLSQQLDQRILSYMKSCNLRSSRN